MDDPSKTAARGFAGRLAAGFIHSKLTPLIIFASVLLGAFSVARLPREEEPQIKVRIIQVMVAMPGASSKEVEERVSSPMGKAAVGSSWGGICLLDLPPRGELGHCAFRGRA